MYLKNLKLQYFRNYQKKTLNFRRKTSLLIGMNGVGKTNILEAIYLLATGNSFKATKGDQMIFYGKELARVVGDIENDKLEIVLTIGEVAGQKARRRGYKLNGVGKRKTDFVGNLKCVLFRPEDIDLVLGSPSVRRDYFDDILEQVDYEYRRSRLSYGKSLRQRNRLLEKIREGEAEKKQLIFWDKSLIKNGQLITKKREEFLDFINNDLGKQKSNLYLEYDKSIISEDRLVKYSDKEVMAGRTLVGPHRDDFKFISEREGKMKKNLFIYGSRGEQRMAVLRLKIAELNFVEFFSGGKPLLLLDDIFSELDKVHRKRVLKLCEKQQAIITTTDKKLIPKSFLEKFQLIEL